MKTTVELPEELLAAARKVAAERRTTLHALLERGLRRELSEHRRFQKPRSITWVTVDGGLPPGIDVANRGDLYDWLRKDV